MDNRIRLPGPKINFNVDVGATGQDHDNYPSPGQARYDHLRMFLIGLLSQQSSIHPPTQYRDGTPWMDTSTDPPTLKINVNGQWVDYGTTIRVGDPNIPLTDWCSNSQATLDALSPEMTFSGTASGNSSNIQIPGPLRQAITTKSHPFVWINGLLVDPRLCSIQSNAIVLAGLTLIASDRFTVHIKSFQPSYMYTPDVTTP